MVVSCSCDPATHVCRFRNLMSTAAGQKFLNENLHRTSVLSPEARSGLLEVSAAAFQCALATNSPELNRRPSQAEPQRSGLTFQSCHLDAPGAWSHQVAQLGAALQHWGCMARRFQSQDCSLTECPIDGGHANLDNGPGFAEQGGASWNAKSHS